MIKKQFTMYIENRPGILATIARQLAEEKVNIEGISVAESTYTALVQLIVSNSEKAEAVLKKADIPNTSQEVCVVELDHEAGSLAEMTAKLAEAEVNINFIYATAAKDQDKCCVVISAADLEKAEKAVSG